MTVVMDCRVCGGELEAANIGQIIAGVEASVILQCSKCNREWHFHVSLDPMRSLSPGEASHHGTVAECGTNSGYHKHRRVPEDACVPCKQAHAEAESLRNAGRRSTPVYA